MVKNLCILLFINSLVSAQTLKSFPPDQHSYMGGREAFYSDFQKIILEKKLSPCENKKEYFHAPIIIDKDDTAIVYDGNNARAPESQCAVALTREVIKSMPGFVAAKIDGKPTVAVAQYLIYPDAFFENYKDGYSPYNQIVQPEFPGGIDAFRELVNHRTDVSNFYLKGKGKVTVVVQFKINKEGSIENVTLKNSSGLKEYDDIIISAVKSIKKKWTPATLHGIIIDYNFSMPLSLSSKDIIR
ncbi:energy transducer TonB [Kaistella pullorum]|nr:TonB family protein [Kaistella pullorum]